MTRNTSRLLGSAAASPSSYTLSECILTTSMGESFDLRGMVTNITITESIYMPSIDAELIVLDGVNLLEELKINGDEKINLTIARISLDGKIREKHKHEFYIAEIVGYSRTNPGNASYMFRCVSKHAYVNNTKTLNRSVKGTIGSIIKTICSKDLHIDSKNLDINTSTDREISAIIPKLRPIATISWLNENAFTATSAPFYFYETLKSGVKYKSYDDFIAEDPKTEFKHTPVLKTTIGSDDYFTETAKRIRKLSSEFNLSKYISTSDGAFAATTHSVDIATKSHSSPQIFNFDKINTINSFKPYPDRKSNAQYGNSKINELITGKNYYINENSLAYNDGYNYHNPTKTHIARCQSYLSIEDTISHDITVSGNFNLECGNILDLKFNKTNMQDNTSQPKDKMLSGNYLVTTIIHEFGDEYTQKIEVKTNSFISDLNDSMINENDSSSREVT